MGWWKTGWNPTTLTPETWNTWVSKAGSFSHRRRGYMFNFKALTWMSNLISAVEANSEGGPIFWSNYDILPTSKLLKSGLSGYSFPLGGKIYCNFFLQFDKVKFLLLTKNDTILRWSPPSNSGKPEGQSRNHLKNWFHVLVITGIRVRSPEDTHTTNISLQSLTVIYQTWGWS